MKIIRALWIFAAEVVAAGGLVFVFLQGWRRDFRVPLYLSYDALEYLMQVKGTIENGWWWTHPRLSAPGVFDQISYPSNTTLDQAIVWLVHLFTPDIGLVINASWMIMLVLSAVVASRCFTSLGVSRRVAVCAGLLFGLSPYALYRNLDHFSLATYLVPIPCAAALLLATGRWDDLRPWIKRALLIGCALLGFNYIYYAFFGCFLIVVASLMAFARERRPGELRRGLLIVGVISLAAAVNLAPTFYNWSRHGKPAAIPQKQAAEAEQYGLKIRHLVGPVFDEAFPPFRRWLELEKDANYPLENENRTSRLGVIGTAGFLLLLAGLFLPGISTTASDRPLFESASRLTLAAVLLATVGGFGSIFNLLISPEIRAYNRITPFIAFFSLTAVALLVESQLRRKPGGPPRWLQVVLIAAMGVGLYDQSRAAYAINVEHDETRQEWQTLGAFVRSLESKLPAGAMVFQLPQLTYLSEFGRGRMLPLDHIRPYLVSSRLHWSFPALDDSIVRWQQRVGRLPASVMPTALRNEGFTVILIDRNGYDDGGKAVATGLGAGAGSDAVIAQDERYLALDLSRLRTTAIAPERLPRLSDPVRPATIGMPACQGTTRASLEWIGASTAPFGPAPLSVSAATDIAVTGWAVDADHGGLAADVDILVGSVTLPAVYGLSRPDVADYLGRSEYRESGFTATLPGTSVQGAQTLSVRIVAADRSCYYAGPEAKVIAR